MCWKEECNCCQEHEQRLDYAKDFLEGIIQILYGNESFNVEKLQDYLDELSWYVGMPDALKKYDHLPLVKPSKTYNYLREKV
jgi:hypothetical protein